MRTTTTARDTLIRKLTPWVMRATGISREAAVDILTRCSPDERALLWKVQGRSLAALRIERNRRRLAA